ncbi:DUF6292 family protein [Actinomadura sp.]|uniref:DUF6292 family protein n=1 Tax=Actinomadura sp. TaxID=1989 RepID=UPI0037C59718
MADSPYPAHHPVEQVDAAHAYITATVTALNDHGIRVDRSHLDPMGPIDATIITGDNALVWDEWDGWQIGAYVSGRQGERTVLRDAHLLGGGILLAPRAVAELVQNGGSLPLATRKPDARDGLFDALRGR